MTDVSVTIGSVTVRLEMPRPAAAVLLPIRGTIGDDVPHVFAAATPSPVPAGSSDESRALAPVTGRAHLVAVTIGATAALITDPATGKYPHKDSFRDELIRALDIACATWGADTPWSTIEESHWTKLYRQRCSDLVERGFLAVRATEITVSRLVTAVRWLRSTKRIPRDAADWPSEYKKEIAKYWKGITGSDRDQVPDRPRYTLDEFQRIIAKSDFDPRLYLLLRLSISLRPGQVARARRSDLELTDIQWDAEVERDEAGNDLTDYGTMMVHGAGKKGGGLVDLTRGQRMVIENALAPDGYLGPIEARYQAEEVGDYKLFPSGYVNGRVGFLRGKETKRSLAATINFAKNVTSSWLRKGWRRAEELAGIPHIDGRSTYGQRRLGVDVADGMGVSPSGLEAVGLWADTKMANEIYRARENRVGRREARTVRARLLGEVGA